MSALELHDVVVDYHGRGGRVRAVAGASLSIEYRSFAADGRLVWIRDEANYVDVDEDGRPGIALGVMYDITAQKEADARAQLAEGQFQTLVERVPAIAYAFPSS